MKIGVDTGGTFTDLVALKDGEVIVAKTLTTPDQSDGVLRTIDGSALDAGEVSFFVHGTTVATNALLERSGARTALITTEGFRDVIEIGRQNRADLYDLSAHRPAPLVGREMRFTVKERMGPGGVIRALEDPSSAVEAVRASGAEAAAVCLLFSYLHPEHERTVAEALRRALPDLHVSTSSDVLREFREYERFSTAVANAYLSPVLGKYLGRLADRVRQRGLPDPLVMQSSGGATPARVAAVRAAACLLSGPAGGVVGASYVAGLSGHREVLSFDMGGTSTDVAAIIGGRALTATEGSVAGLPVRLPMVDIHTIGSGGGSVAWVDEGGALRVGPRSVGANPGPACYGLGGREPSVTDAAVCLGFIPDGRRLAGSVSIDASAAASAVKSIGERLGLPVEEAAAGIARVAEASMGKALRVVSVERGLDPRRFALMAFGGAGPMHACRLAEQLGIPTVLVPRACGVLSALGLAISEIRTDASRPLHALVGDEIPAAVEEIFLEMQAGAKEPGAVVIRRADLRYRGQSFELTVDAGAASALVENFHAAHQQRYGYRMDGAPVEIVTLRLTSVLQSSKPVLSEPAGTGVSASSHRRVFFDDRWEQTPVFERGLLGTGDRVEGPAVVEFGEATCVVNPGWAGAIDDSGTLVLKRG